MLSDEEVIQKRGMTLECRENNVVILFNTGKKIVVDLFKDTLFSSNKGDFLLPNNFKVGDGVIWYDEYYTISEIEFPKWFMTKAGVAQW